MHLGSLQGNQAAAGREQIGIPNPPPPQKKKEQGKGCGPSQIDVAVQE